MKRYNQNILEFSTEIKLPLELELLYMESIRKLDLFILFFNISSRINFNLPEFFVHYNALI